MLVVYVEPIEVNEAIVMVASDKVLEYSLNTNAYRKCILLTKSFIFVVAFGVSPNTSS